MGKIKELETQLQSLKKSKRYGLVWEDKPEDVVEQCKKELPVLVSDESKTIEKDPN
jgi:adenine-specific DNA-methyltransferase